MRTKLILFIIIAILGCKQGRTGTGIQDPKIFSSEN